MSDKTFLIAHIEHTTKDHEHITWWKPDSNGYTYCIDKAGLYCESEALAICSHGTCIAVAKSVVEPMTCGTPYYRKSTGQLASMYDGMPHTVVPNSSENWKRLLSSHIGNTDSLDRPTPISMKKSRAIYLDRLDNLL